jgi:hypothetical protein
MTNRADSFNFSERVAPITLARFMPLVMHAVIPVYDVGFRAQYREKAAASQSAL